VQDNSTHWQFTASVMGEPVNGTDITLTVR